MSDCECGAHYLQNCSWWCGLTEEAQEVGYEQLNPQYYILQELREIKSILESKQEPKGNKDE